MKNDWESDGFPGSLRVWWIPQVPGKAFHVKVEGLEEAVKILDVLALYDQFQYDNRIKGDYCNVGGLEIWEDNGDGFEWYTWYDEETGEEDPRKVLKSK